MQAWSRIIVRFPARTYAVKGERRRFVLFRPIADATVQDAIRDRILDAYARCIQRPCSTRDEPAVPLGAAAACVRGVNERHGR